MPLLWTQSIYEAMYNVGDPTDGSRRVHYTRELFNLNRQWVGKRLTQISQQHNITNADVLVVGCGFGWLIEQLIDAGVGTSVGVDPSPFVHANRATESRADVTIVDATVGVDDVQTALRDAGLPRNWDVVIDEDAASSHSDAELADFLDGCEDLVKGNKVERVIHLVTPVLPRGPGDSAINWKTMAEWAAIRPSHTWVDIRSGEVA